MDRNDMLIQAVQKHSCIYKRGTSNYRNNACRAVAWAEIGAELKWPARLCQRRWRAIRDRYVRFVSKQASGSDAEDLDDEKWSKLSFLKGHIRPKRSMAANNLTSTSPEVEYLLEGMDDMSACNGKPSSWTPLDKSPSSNSSRRTEDLNIVEIKTSSQTHPVIFESVDVGKILAGESDVESFVEDKYSNHIQDTPAEKRPNTSGNTNNRRKEDNNALREEFLSFMSDVKTMAKQRLRNTPAIDSTYLNLLGEKLNELPEEQKEATKIYFLSYVYELISQHKHPSQ